jgi:hypothetical protein
MRYTTIASHDQDIKHLKKDTQISVFLPAKPLQIKEYILKGIDAKKQVTAKPRYEAGIENSIPKAVRGLLVLANLETACKFGEYFIKIKTTPKSMIPTFLTSAYTSVAPVEEWRHQYPSSDYPILSAGLDGHGRKNYPQAIYRGLLSPRAIESVYIYAKDSETEEAILARCNEVGFNVAMKYRQIKIKAGSVFVLSAKTFVGEYLNKLKFTKEERPFTQDQYEIHPAILEPQERDIDADTFQLRLANWFKRKNAGVALTDDVLKRKLDFFNSELRHKLEECSDTETQQRMLETCGLGYDYIPVSVARRLLPKLLQYYKLRV